MRMHDSEVFCRGATLVLGHRRSIEARTRRSQAINLFGAGNDWVDMRDLQPRVWLAIRKDCADKLCNLRVFLAFWRAVSQTDRWFMRCYAD